jgi:hypothetical protein
MSNENLSAYIGTGVRFIYSCVMDEDSCDVCKSAEGQESDDPRHLPSAPNPECKGECGCMIIIARD